MVFSGDLRSRRGLALEIERRFLVVGDGWRRHSRGVRALRQGYLLAAADGLTLRVRTSRPLADQEDELSEASAGQGGGQATQSYLTIKAAPPVASTGEALCRLEFEYPIPIADGDALIALAGSTVRKQRHHLDLPGGDWVLDVFEAENAPLVVAEVELLSPDQAVPIPSWCAREVSGRRELSNAALALHPFASWSPEEQRELLG
jgi:CYTH domain-containing protein